MGGLHFYTDLFFAAEDQKPYHTTYYFYRYSKMESGGYQKHNLLLI